MFKKRLMLTSHSNFADITMKKTTLLFMAVALVGCTNKDLYNTGQTHQRNQCIKNATNEAERDACYSQQNPSFEDYEKERKKVIDGKDDK